MAQGRPAPPARRAPPAVRPKPLPRLSPRRPDRAATPPSPPAPPIDLLPVHPAALLRAAVATRAALAGDFYHLGELLIPLSKPAALAALGFTRLQDLLRAYDLPGRTTAFKLMRIVKQYPRDTALQMGRAKAYALLSLADAGGEVEDADGASVRDITERGRRLRELRGKTRRGRAPASALNRARRMRTHLRRLGAVHARVRILVVAVGKIWYRAEVPEDEAHVFEAD